MADLMHTMAPSSAAEKADVPYYVIGLSMAVPALLFGLFLGASWVAVFAAAQGRVDFRQLYAAAYMVRTHHAYELYDYDSQRNFQNTLVSPAKLAMPFIRPAYQALVFVPLSFLPFRVAYIAWFGVNLVLLYYWLRFSRPFTQNLKRIWPYLPLALTIAFIPVDVALVQGQDSILLLVLFAATLRLLECHKPASAGAAMALGLFKFQLVLPLVFLLCLWRRWRFCAGFALAAAGLAGLSAWVTGVRQSLFYLSSLVSYDSASKTTGLRFAVPFEFMPNIHGLLASSLGHHASRGVNTGLVLLCSITFLIWVWRSRNAVWTATDEFLVAICAGVLLSYYVFSHDMSILLIPVSLALNDTVLCEQTESFTGKLLLRVATLLFVAPIMILFAPAFVFLISLLVAAFLAASTRWLRCNRSSRSVV